MDVVILVCKYIILFSVPKLEKKKMWMFGHSFVQCSSFTIDVQEIGTNMSNVTSILKIFGDVTLCSLNIKSKITHSNKAKSFFNLQLNRSLFSDHWPPPPFLKIYSNKTNLYPSVTFNPSHHYPNPILSIIT